MGVESGGRTPTNARKCWRGGEMIGERVERIRLKRGWTRPPLKSRRRAKYADGEDVVPFAGWRSREPKARLPCQLAPDKAIVQDCRHPISYRGWQFHSPTAKKDWPQAAVETQWRGDQVRTDQLPLR